MKEHRCHRCGKVTGMPFHTCAVSDSSPLKVLTQYLRRERIKKEVAHEGLTKHRKRKLVSEPTDAQKQAGKAYYDLVHRSETEREGKVLAFLRENPLSTNDEIFAATGIGIGSIRQRFVRYVRYQGQVCWRINRKKYNRWLKHG